MPHLTSSKRIAWPGHSVMICCDIGSRDEWIPQLEAVPWPQACNPHPNTQHGIYNNPAPAASRGPARPPPGHRSRAGRQKSRVRGDPADTLAHRDDAWVQLACRSKWGRVGRGREGAAREGAAGDEQGPAGNGAREPGLGDRRPAGHRWARVSIPSTTARSGEALASVGRGCVSRRTRSERLPVRASLEPLAAGPGYAAALRAGRGVRQPRHRKECYARRGTRSIAQCPPAPPGCFRPVRRSCPQAAVHQRPRPPRRVAAHSSKFPPVRDFPISGGARSAA
jgi:hypothetical protein